MHVAKATQHKVKNHFMTMTAIRLMSLLNRPAAFLKIRFQMMGYGAGRELEKPRKEKKMGWPLDRHQYSTRSSGYKDSFTDDGAATENWKNPVGQRIGMHALLWIYR